MIGHGVSSRSSHSWAAGRITSAAKPCTQSRMSFWSWLSASENVTSWPAAPEIASTAASAASVAAGVARSDVADADIGGFSWSRRRGRDLDERACSRAGAPQARRRLPGATATQTGEKTRSPLLTVKSAREHLTRHVSNSEEREHKLANPDLVYGLHFPYDHVSGFFDFLDFVNLFDAESEYEKTNPCSLFFARRRSDWPQRVRLFEQQRRLEQRSDARRVLDPT